MKEIERFIKIQPDLALLALRISLAWVFIPSGYKKLLDLEGAGESFANLGLPMVGFFAILVGLTEFLGGWAVLSGIVTRFAAFALSITMIVAIILLLGSGAEFSRLNLALAMLASSVALMAYDSGKYTLSRVLKISNTA